MLPSTKLFKTINCPFNEAETDCSRPYCHFNHTKPDPPPNALTSTLSQPKTQTLQPPVPVYIPTPKHILEARKANSSTTEVSESPVKKKPKLEYVPKAITNTSGPIPTYIPSTLRNTSCDEYEPAPIVNDETATSIDNIECESNGGFNVESNGGPNGDDMSGLMTDLLSENGAKVENNLENGKKDKENENSKELKDSKKEKSKDESDKSSSSRHRHHSSSSHKSSRSDKSHSDRKSSRSGSSHKTSHHSSSSSSSSSRKTKHSDKEKDISSKEKHRHGSRSSKDGKHKSSEHRSKSSSSSSRRHSSSHSSDKNDNSSNNKEDCINESIVYGTESEEEDDVEAQCRMIFEEFDPSTIEIKPDDMPNGSSAEEESNDKNEDVTKNKRIAHENINKQINPMDSFKKKANHFQNAMQSVHLRQEMIRKQIEAKEAEARKEFEKRELLQSLESDKPEPKVMAPKQNLTPLIPPAALIAPRKTFSPVSNMLAIQRAKEKVAELKAQKLAQHQQYMPKTIAQTTQKGTGRIAHANVVTPTAKPAPPVLEPTSTKISNNIRMQYYNLMVKHCLTIYDDCNDAWERAQTEEHAVFKKCNTVVIYKSSALLTINKLRKESLDAGNVNTERNKVISHDVILAGKHGQNTSWNLKRKPSTDGSSNIIDNIASSKAYEMIAELCMTDDQLKENGYPRSGNKPGFAIIHKKQGAAPANENDRYCRRCGTVYKLDEYDEECIDRCNYHPKSPGFRRGFADNSLRCCQQPAGSPGCMYANYHVTDYLDPNNLTGFIKTIACDDDYVPTRKDIFALDCEMCYTTAGLELTRVTVVDINRKIVYDALVKPDNRIIDYNTIYSGISEKTLQNVNRTLRDVQAVLLSMFNSKTILVGHSLESDFKALKLIHDMVVDTSILYPHKMGPPKKRALKTLCIENLKRIIQEDDAGHNSAEDAEVCIDLVKHYLRNRIK